VFLSEIISYPELVAREKANLQKGMNFGIRPGYSIILMSVRRGAPYHDRIDLEKNLLIYEGHDVPRSHAADPKTVDQPMANPGGSPTENGKFYKAAKDSEQGYRQPERVKVYEKIQRGVWSDKGFFHLVGSAIVERNGRKVFDFFLRPVEERSVLADRDLPANRLIPTEVKVAVWKRDHGKCVLCGSQKNLHYDHDLPYSKGGSSITIVNVRLLCATCNLKKSAKIEAWLPIVLGLAAFRR
jgi:HNH endonuclease